MLASSPSFFDSVSIWASKSATERSVVSSTAFTIKCCSSAACLTFFKTKSTDSPSFLERFSPVSPIRMFSSFVPAFNSLKFFRRILISDRSTSSKLEASCLLCSIVSSKSLRSAFSDSIHESRTSRIALPKCDLTSSMFFRR